MEQIKRKRTIYELIFKRPLDFILSLIALIILSPVMIVVAILVRIKLGGPVLFKQDRSGKNEKIFKMYKFRTMTNKTDNEGNLLPDEIRLTKFGKFLRSTSLDELPGLFNILKGNMSIVGPRPLAVLYLPYYTEDENKRHLVRPGLTGLAQINGRNNIVWEERFEFDVKYIQKITFFNDIKIIFLTFLRVLKRKDIGARNKGVSIDFNIYRENQRREGNELKG